MGIRDKLSPMKNLLFSFCLLALGSCEQGPKKTLAQTKTPQSQPSSPKALGEKKDARHSKVGDPSVHEALSAETLFDIGVRHFNAKKFDDALAHLSLGIQKYPKHPEFYDARASVFVERKEFTKALADREKAVSLLPDNPGYLVNRAFLYFKFGRYDSGMKDLEKAISLEPLYYPAHFLKARMLAGKKAFKDALKEYNLCESSDPKIAKTYGTRAFVHWAMGNSKAAFADMEKYAAMVKDPEQKEMAKKAIDAWKAGEKGEKGGK
jgi:tetratricopeptide (TPR) repeat protein